MKRVILLLSFFVLMTAVFAQLPLWTIRPDYDSMEIKLDKKLIASDSAGITSLWTFDGKHLFATPDKIMPYRENHAIVVNEANEILGILDTDGSYTKVEGLSVAFSDPYFHDGYMICSNGSGYVYINTDGETVSLTPAALKQYPFRSGYAPYMTYANFDKLKDPHYRYYSAAGSAPKFVINGKEVEDKEVKFLSGIAPTGKGVAVIKHKLYWFDAATSALSPMLAGPETESEKKRHLELYGDYDDYFQYLPIVNDIEINCKYGKNRKALLKFGPDLVPHVFSFDGEPMTFEYKADEKIPYASNLSHFGNDKKGLKYKDADFLPEQFDAVGIAYDDNVMVKLGNKWGVLSVNPALNLKMTMNQGDDIAFRHQKFYTQMRIDIPASISANSFRIEIPGTTGCEIDHTSRTHKDTEYGNFVQYDCVLTIPRNLPDSITPIIYDPVKISYDRLQLPNRSFTVNAWHLKYYNVDPIDSETSVKDGVATFTVNIDAQRNAGDHDYPFDVKIVADSIFVNYEKLSETRYKCIVSNLQEGLNHMSVVITEKGCPSSFFPFEISYVKPVEKEVLEAVTIRKISDLELFRLPKSLELPKIASPIPAATGQTPADSDTPEAGNVQKPLDPLTKMVLGIE